PSMSATFGGQTDLWAAIEPDQAFQRELSPVDVELIRPLATLARLDSGRGEGVAVDEINARLTENLESDSGLQPNAKLDVYPRVVRNILVHREALAQIYLF